MAAKVPDNVTNNSVTRINLGQKSLFILDFFVENLDDGDTISGAGELLTNVEACWCQTSSAGQTDPPRLTRSGTGNTTVTFNTTVANWNGQVFLFGTP